jgi:hypothetical protein
MTIETIFIVLPTVIDKKILLLIDQNQYVTPACLKIGSQLDGQSRTRLLAEPSVDAAGEIDPKPSRISAPVCSFGRLHGDTTRRADCRAEITGYTTLITIRIPGEDDHTP